MIDHSSAFATAWSIALIVLGVVVLGLLASVVAVIGGRRRTRHLIVSYLSERAGPPVGSPGAEGLDRLGAPRRRVLGLRSTIRPAEPGDLAAVAEIERYSEQALTRTGSGLGALPSPGFGVARGRKSVVLVAGRPAVAFARVDEVDGLAHLDQLAVLPAMMRQGIGKALLQAAIDWARDHGYRAVTLSTFADAPWISPLYRAKGFAPLTELSPGLVELRDWEQAIGLDALGARVVMRREL